MKGELKMNILVALNSNYVRQLTVMLHSMMLSNPNEYFDIYVAHSSLTQHDFRKISDATDTTRCRIHPVKIKNETLDNAPVLKRISKETYYRLLAAEYLPEYLDRILYLDPDTVIMNPLDGFYNIDFGDNLIVGATHVALFIKTYNLKRLDMPANGEYINAGVMLMNLDGLRKSYSSKEIFEYIELNKKKLYLADQDVINALYGDRTLVIRSELINLDEKTFKRSGKSLAWVEENTLIVHYDGKMKPWKPGYKGVLDKYYKLIKPEVPVRLTELIGA